MVDHRNDGRRVPDCSRLARWAGQVLANGTVRCGGQLLKCPWGCPRETGMSRRLGDSAPSPTTVRLGSHRGQWPARQPPRAKLDEQRHETESNAPWLSRRV